MANFKIIQSKVDFRISYKFCIVNKGKQCNGIVFYIINCKWENTYEK